MEQQPMKRTIITSSITAALTATLVLSGAWLLLQNDPEALIDLAVKADPSSGTKAPAASPAEAAVIAAVQKANPAVVAITVSRNIPIYERYFEQIPSPFWGSAGGISIPRVRLKGTELREVGGGSGFLISPDGYIVTNRHVVADESAEYAVFTNDGQKYEARIIARDPARDIAVIKINGIAFPHLSFGDSDQLQPGQTVIAIGNALAEFRNTVSVGVVSGLSRSIEASDRGGRVEELDQLIQTDAGINPGNSGGPLLNLAGEVVGINVAVAEEAENVGFALSANSVKSIVAAVKE